MKRTGESGELELSECQDIVDGIIGRVEADNACVVELGQSSSLGDGEYTCLYVYKVFL